MTATLDTTAPPSTLSTALALAARGWHVFPVDHPGLPSCAGMHGTATPCDRQRGKHPAARWSTAATAESDVIAAAFAGTLRNLGIACGPSGLVVLDEDAPGELARWQGDVGVALPPTFTVTTGRGTHHYYAAPEGVTIGNRAAAFAGYRVDVRGTGGYVVGPGSVHATGTLYEAVDPAAPVAPLPAGLAALLGAPDPAATSSTARADRPAFSTTVRHHEPIGYGERHTARVAYAGRLRKRGLDLAEAEILYRDRWRYCVQPPRTVPEARFHEPAPPGGPDYPVEWSEARSKLLDVFGRYPAGGSIADPEATADPVPSAPARSWLPVDLAAVLDGNWTPPAATVGRRDDGVGLLYPARVHTLTSETEGGKTWFSVALAASELADGNAVVYLDFEDDEGGVVGRLLAIGAKADAIRARFAYIRPDAPVTALGNRDDLRAAIGDLRPSYVVLDGVTEAMSLHGLELKDNSDVARFGQLLPRAIADTGPAVLSLDHVVKDREGRGRYAIGGVHKLNAVNGAAYTLDNRQPFGVGMTGRSTLLVAKDRPGAVRRHAVRTRNGTAHWLADLVITSHDETFAEVGLEPPTTQDADWRPTTLMGRVADTLTKHGPLSQRRIIAAVGGRRQTAIDALNYLILDGYVSETSPHQLVRPYGEGCES